jgi:hypothetical protein
MPLDEEAVRTLLLDMTGSKRGNVKRVAEDVFGVTRCQLSAQINGCSPITNTVLKKLGLKKTDNGIEFI